MRVLRDVDPGAAVWTWGTDRTAAFYLRRAHQETIIHRVDAELALGDRTPVPADDGLDGLEELLAARDKEGLLKSFTRITKQCWDEKVTIGEGDAAVRGTGEELLLLMWGRRGLEGLEVFGDADIVAEWARLSP